MPLPHIAQQGADWARGQYNWARGQTQAAGPFAQRFAAGRIAAPFNALGQLGGNVAIGGMRAAGTVLPPLAGTAAYVGTSAGIGALGAGLRAAGVVGGLGTWLYNWGKASYLKEKGLPTDPLRRPRSSLIKKYPHGWQLNRKAQWTLGIGGLLAYGAYSYFKSPYPLNPYPGVDNANVTSRSRFMGLGLNGSFQDQNGAGADLTFAHYNINKSHV